AEDGIRDDLVTGVQTCALPICCGVNREESLLRPTAWRNMASRRLFSLPVPGDLETSKSGPWSYRGSSSVHPRSDRPGDGESGLGRTPPPGPNCGIPRCSLTAAMGS